MKGIVFREFIDFVEEQAGYDIVDEMIERADPPSGAAYTAVGKYDWREMVDLVSALSDITSAPVPDLIRAFGTHLFGRLKTAYPQFLQGPTSAFEFLETIENEIHVEVLKLYPDAELPTLDVRKENDGTMLIGYSSCRPFGDLCIGMIEGCAEHFGESFDIQFKKKEGGLDIQMSRIAQEAA